MHQTGVHDAIHSWQNAIRRTSRAAAYPVDCGKRPILSGTRLMQFLRVPVHPGGLHGYVGHTQTTKPVDQLKQVRVVVP